jgi:hypothetical protein
MLFPGKLSLQQKERDSAPQHCPALLLFQRFSGTAQRSGEILGNFLDEPRRFRG